jgi:hypothetical protein
MPWRGLRLNPAGGQKSRRHSFFEKGDPPAADGHRESEIVEPNQQLLDMPINESTGLQPPHNASPDLTTPEQTTPDTDPACRDMPVQMRNDDPATVSRSHRFSLLRFRHASDPQLSRSYTTSAPSSTPPLPHPASKSLMPCQPEVWTTDSHFHQSTYNRNHRTDRATLKPQWKDERQIEGGRTLTQSLRRASCDSPQEPCGCSRRSFRVEHKAECIQGERCCARSTSCQFRAAQSVIHNVC